jgi:very-short-patch-repair endonuclease
MKYQLKIFTICNQITQEASKYNITRHPLAVFYKDDIMLETKMFPSSINFSKRIRAIAENNDCVCKTCGIVYGDVSKNGYCTSTCYQTARQVTAVLADDFPIYNARRIGEIKFANKTEGVDYLVCKICEAKTGELGTHIRMHNMSPTTYKQTYSLLTLKTQHQRDQMKGSNNPAYQHGGKFSPFSSKFKNGYDKEWHDNFIQNRKIDLAENKHKYKTNIEYWIDHTDGDIDAASALYKKFQTRDLSFFTAKYGTTQGTIKWKLKIERWIKNFKSVNYSKISQQLFNEIMEVIPNHLKPSIYYATLNQLEMVKYTNKEYVLHVGSTYIRPDFICLDNKKIIEFDGAYWHSAAKTNPLREATRDKLIIDSGFSVLHIREQDYKKNKEEAIHQCIKFLIQ